MTFYSPITETSPLALATGAILCAPHLDLPGSATVAIRRALDELPQEVQGSTLEELADPDGLLVRILDQARDQLSEPMRHAFLNWLDASLRVDTSAADDDEATDAMADKHADAIELLAATPARHLNDVLMKAHLLALSDGRGNKGALGPLATADGVGDTFIETTSQALARDLITHSTLSANLDRLAAAGQTRKAQALAAIRNAQELFSLPQQSSILPHSGHPAPVIGRDLYPLPNLPWGVSAELVRLTDSYAGVFTGMDEGCADRWDEVALEIAAFTPRNTADAAVKLMYGLHYLHPNLKDGRLAIETEDFACNSAGEILIATMLDLLRWSGAGGITSASTLPPAPPSGGATQRVNPDDEATLAAFRRYELGRLAHRMLPDSASSDLEVLALRPADEAEDAMMTLRPSSLAAIVAKLRIGFAGASDDAWIDETIFNPQSDEFRDGLAKSDQHVRILYSAIEDLARVAGVEIKGVELETDQSLTWQIPEGGVPVPVIGEVVH